MNKAPQLVGEHVAADDGIFIEEKPGLDALLSGGVVGDFVGVALYPLAPVGLQVKPLAGLELQVLGVGFVKLLRED